MILNIIYLISNCYLLFIESSKNRFFPQLNFSSHSWNFKTFSESYAPTLDFFEIMMVISGEPKCQIMIFRKKSSHFCSNLLES